MLTELAQATWIFLDLIFRIQFILFIWDKIPIGLS